MDQNNDSQLDSSRIEMNVDVSASEKESMLSKKKTKKKKKKAKKAINEEDESMHFVQEE